MKENWLKLPLTCESNSQSDSLSFLASFLALSVTVSVADVDVEEETGVAAAHDAMMPSSTYTSSSASENKTNQSNAAKTQWHCVNCKFNAVCSDFLFNGHTRLEKVDLKVVTEKHTLATGSDLYTAAGNCSAPPNNEPFDSTRASFPPTVSKDPPSFTALPPLGLNLLTSGGRDVNQFVDLAFKIPTF